MTTDPIADLLTRIRNALSAKHKKLTIPHSTIKKDIVDLLVKKNYLKSLKKTGKTPKSALEVKLKYQNNKPAITSLTRISKPGVRVYASTKELPALMRGLGILILSTGKGIMTAKEALKKNLGGEVICKIT